MDRHDHRLRLNLLLSGLAGLVVSGLIAATSIWLVSSGTIPVLAPFPIVTLLLAVVLGAFSIAEIPMMVFLMRRLLIERPENRAVVFGLNVLYVLFASIYGAPVLLLTGSLGWGLALCSLSVVRLATSILWVPQGPDENEVQA